MSDPNVSSKPVAEIYFERALAEYRDLTGDFHDFADLPAEAQNEILRRVHHIREDQEREKRG